MLSFHLVILVQMLCGCSFVPVQSQITVSQPISHTLPPELESGLFGSPVNGGCSSISGTNNEICDGTSVLNDGILPALSGVSNDSQSQWAAKLFTMRRSGTDRIVVSFEFPIASRNRLELAVFNCPQLGIYAPQVSVYVANAMNVDLTRITDMTISQVSCEHLLKFCVELGGAGVPNLNLVFPYQNNSDFVFLGEVTFLSDPSDFQCDPPELITMTLPPQTLATTGHDLMISISTSNATTNYATFEELPTISTIITNNKQRISQCTAIATTAGVVSAIITALLVGGICIAIHITVYQCFYKPRLRSSTSTAVGGHDESHSQREDVMGSGDAIVYDVVNERSGVGAVLEMRENEAYSVNKRVEEPGMKQNEAYGVVRPD